jgi:hypothetical protein
MNASITSVRFSVRVSVRISVRFSVLVWIYRLGFHPVRPPYSRLTPILPREFGGRTGIWWTNDELESTDPVNQAQRLPH